MALLNYNRSILTNQVDTFTVVLTGVDQLILQFGLFVPQATNFIFNAPGLIPPTSVGTASSVDLVVAVC